MAGRYRASLYWNSRYYARMGGEGGGPGGSVTAAHPPRMSFVFGTLRSLRALLPPLLLGLPGLRMLARRLTG